MRNAVVLPVINAVQTLACALKQGEIANKCNTSSPVCIQNITKTTMKYFGKQKCDLLDHSVVFNKLGFFNRDFKIFNFDGVDYRSVGRWVYNSSAEKSKLYLDVDKVVWRHNKLPASYCYVPCTFGQAFGLMVQDAALAVEIVAKWKSSKTEHVWPVYLIMCPIGIDQSVFLCRLYL